MRIYVRCEGCGREAEPTWQSGGGWQNQMGAHTCNVAAPPSGWAEIDGHLLCADCITTVRAAIGDAIHRRPPKASP